MINSDVQEAINQQINQELSAAYSYLGMSAYFEHEELSGFASWCFAQYKEELEHAHRLFDYLLSRDGGKIELTPIAAPKSDYQSTLQVFETALQQEQKNTESINSLYRIAAAANDNATVSHLQWFIDEQVEEEKTASENLALVKLAGSDPHAILYLNDRYGGRKDSGKS